MSDRSSEWYAVPSNAAKRKARMRAYGRALVALGQLYPEERKQAYRDGMREEGLASPAAQSRASRCLRDAHPEKFAELFEKELAEPSDPRRRGRDRRRAGEQG